MMGNPEFRRNLWLQFSANRVLIAGMLTGLLLACAAALDFALTREKPFEPDILAFVSHWLALVILILWAGRQAAGAVLREIRGRTWDAQRMSTLHPWSMAWGKLLGTTSLAWLLALVCIACYAAAATFFRKPADVGVTIAAVIGYGVVCQATGLLASLARLSGRPGESGGSTTLAQGIGLVATGLLGALVVWGLESEGRWFGNFVGEQALRLATIWMFALWAIAGIYRRMRRELQMRSVPWAWTAFLVTLVVYAEGLAYGRDPQQMVVLVPIALLQIMVWAMVVIEAKDALTLRQCFAALRGGRLFQAGTLVPLWLVTYALFVVAAIAALIVVLTEPHLATLRIPFEGNADVVLIIVAALLFVTRDVLLVQTMALSRDGGMAGLYGAIFWFVFYFAVPAVFIAGQQGKLLGAFLPIGRGSWELCLLPALGEVLLCAALCAWRWRAYWRENAIKAPS